MLEATLLVTDEELFTLDELATELATELTDELFTEELTTELLELLAMELAAIELKAIEDVLDVVPEQTLPVTTGFSATPPFLSPCTPKLTD
jgi:hypothetical protein